MQLRVFKDRRQSQSIRYYLVQISEHFQPNEACWMVPIFPPESPQRIKLRPESFEVHFQGKSFMVDVGLARGFLDGQENFDCIGELEVHNSERLFVAVNELYGLSSPISH